MANHFIIDPSSLVYGGVGTLKKWVDKVQREAVNRGEKTNSATDDAESKTGEQIEPKYIFYVPLYTIRELDFLKKVFNPLISSNARESIRYLDEQMGKEEFLETETATASSNEKHEHNLSDFEDSDLDEPIEDSASADGLLRSSSFGEYVDFESFNRMKIEESRSASTTNLPRSNERRIRNPVSFILENKNDNGPDWSISSGYRRYTPSLSDLPKPINGFSSKGQLTNDDNGIAVGVFGNNIPGMFNVHSMNGGSNSRYNATEIIGGNLEIDERAVVPLRLRFLIRSCIQKQYIENKLREKQKLPKIDWIVMCEDPTTSIWLKSFGLNVKTINEIQLELNEKSDNSGSNDKVKHHVIDGSSLKISQGRGNARGQGNNLLFDPISGTFVASDDISKKEREKKKRVPHRRNSKQKNKDVNEKDSKKDSKRKSKINKKGRKQDKQSLDGNNVSQTSKDGVYVCNASITADSYGSRDKQTVDENSPFE